MNKARCGEEKEGEEGGWEKKEKERRIRGRGRKKKSEKEKRKIWGEREGMEG